MAIAQLEALTIATDDAWTLTAGSSKPVAVNSPDDDDTTRIGTTTNGQKESFFLTQLSGAAVVNTVSAFSRTRDNDGALQVTFRTFLRLSGSVTNAGTHLTAVGTAYGNNTDSSLARPGGGAWSMADVNAMELGIERTAGGVVTMFCTTLYALVDYTPFSGGFVYLMGCWIPPLLAVASHGLSLAEVATFLSKFKTRPGGPSMREELDLVHRAYLVRPRFAFPFTLNVRSSKFEFEPDMIHRGLAELAF